MGVPAFFKWLVNKYCKAVEPVKKSTECPCDNLYIDMNGIIHPATQKAEVCLYFYSFPTQKIRIRKQITGTEFEIEKKIFPYF